MYLAKHFIFQKLLEKKAKDIKMDKFKSVKFL